MPADTLWKLIFWLILRHIVALYKPGFPEKDGPDKSIADWIIVSKEHRSYYQHHQYPAEKRVMSAWFYPSVGEKQGYDNRYRQESYQV